MRAGAGGKALSLEAAGKRAMRGGDDDEAVTAAADAQVLNGAFIEPYRALIGPLYSLNRAVMETS